MLLGQLFRFFFPQQSKHVGINAAKCYLWIGITPQMHDSHNRHFDNFTLSLMNFLRQPLYKEKHLASNLR